MGTVSGGPVVKNPPSNAGDTSLIPDLRTKIPQATGQLSPHVITAEPVPSTVRVPQLEKPRHCNEDPVQPKKKKNFLTKFVGLILCHFKVITKLQKLVKKKI